MTRITVLGGTGYAGEKIVAEAAARGHDVTSLSRSVPTDPVASVRYVQGDATDEAVLASVIDGADVVVAALAPRGELAGRLRAVYGTVVRLAAAAGARLLVVGGFTTLRPAPDAPRFAASPEDVPEAFRAEALEVAAFATEDLPAAPGDLDWVFVAPAANFGAHAPGERLGRYRLSEDVALFDDAGQSAISGADYASAVLDLAESRERARTIVNAAY